METELKYSVDEKRNAEDIFGDEEITALKIGGSERLIPMHAVYFDTEDEDMSKDLMAMRIRLEGKTYVATLKWSGGSKDGLHRREEVNVPVDDEILIKKPGIDIFNRCEIFEQLKSITEDKDLIPVMEMKFTRREVRLNTGRSVSVLSYDMGEIRANGKTAPISEIELELSHGDEEDFRKLGRKISEKYMLPPEDVSKFQRGKLLMNK